MLREDLPSLQKSIVKTLAVKGPLTKNEVKENLKAEYHSILIAFNALQKKKLIRTVDKKKYRGRVFDRYWLTEDGLIFALLFDVKVEVMKPYASQIYNESIDDVNLFFELAGIFSPKRLFAFMVLTRAGEGKKFNAHSLKLANIPIREKEIDDFLTVLLKHPRIQRDVEKTGPILLKALKKMGKELGKDQPEGPKTN